MIETNKYSKILNMISLKEWGHVKHALMDILSVEIVEIMRECEEHNKPIVFRLLSREQSADVFAELSATEQEVLIAKMNEQEIQELLHEMSPDDRTALFEELPADITKQVFSVMKEADLLITKQLLGYPEDSIGRLMTPDFLDVNISFTVAQTLDYIRTHGRDSEIFEVIYVVDKNETLLGYLLLKDLLFANSASLVSNLMRQDIVSISVYDDQEHAVVLSKKYNLFYIPVVDSHNAIIGIVTVDDILDIAEEEDTEDFHKLGAISSVDHPFDDNLKLAPAFTLYRKRIPWLFVLVFVNVVSGAVIGLFEETISKYIVLVFFLPLLIDSAGNAGAQSSTLMIRAFATGDVKKSDWLFMLMKELRVSSLLGFTMSAGVAFVAMWRGGITIACVVALSMMLVVLVGSVIGLCLPFILNKLKLDPAASSVPLVASLCDISGTAIYLTLATVLLKLY